MKANEHRILKKYGEKLGRAGLASRILELGNKIASDDTTYKDAITIAGHIQALAIACGYECYWREKRDDGYYNELQNAKKLVQENR